MVSSSMISCFIGFMTLSSFHQESHGFISGPISSSSILHVLHVRTHSDPKPNRTRLQASLKPAAIPLLDAGKALARSGELLIEYTSTSENKLYGGGLSSAGANIRNAGDCVAQAAASTRFKTAMELVCDELREAGTCLLEGSNDQLTKGVDDANVDDNALLSSRIENLIPSVGCVGIQLEMAGKRIMKKESVENIGGCLVEGGECLYNVALGIQKFGDDEMNDNDQAVKAAKESCNRMLYAAEKMKEAGNNLKGVQPEKKKGKAWLKG